MNKVYNYTRSESSYNQADLEKILNDQPRWRKTDIIVGGGGGCPYFLISGWDRYRIRNCDDSYVIEPLNTDTPVTECSCGALLLYSSVLGIKDRGNYVPPDEDLVHCNGCHRVWDGNAQCQCPW